MKEVLENDLHEILEIQTEILRDHKCAPESIPAYSAEVRRFFNWRAECGYRPSGFQLVTSFDIKAYLNNHKRFNLPIARNRALAALLSFFPLCYRIGGHKTTPTRTIPNASNPQKPNYWLDGEQQWQLEEAIDQLLQTPLDMIAWQVNRVRSAVLVRFLLHTGMHSVEVRSLRLGDIRLGASCGVVHVRGKRERRVPLDGLTCAALRVWLTVRPEGKDDRLWLEEDRGEALQLSERAIWRACRRMVQLAGLDPEAISPRILRNTCAHNLLVAGESPRVVKRLMKFSTTKMAERYL
jgi:site-specific recombinase XerD